MAYTETTRTSYGKRLGNSLRGIGTGFLLFIGGTVLLWWNEGRAVRTTAMLKEAQGQTVEMADISRIDPSFEGKLVHAVGLAETADSLFDSQFNVGTRGIAMKREAKYYQWVEKSHSETKDKIGGESETTTTYTYDLEWTDSPVNSADFHESQYRGENTVKQNVDDMTWYADTVTFGAYRLNESQIRGIDSYTTLPVAGDSTMIYIGEDPGKPDVGDVMITYTQISTPQKISIIAKVTGDSFTHFTAKNGETLSVLEKGEVSKDEMFDHLIKANKFWLWALRIIGFFLVFYGLKGIFSIIETLFKVLPFLANIIGWGVGLVCGLVAFVWTILIVVISWIAHRPILGISLLVVAGVAIWYFATHKKKGAPDEAEKGSEPPAA
ncbi:MAG: TMEM43 family protein [Bacteroidales bacterium]|nr:TMEM43 family protein [Bacteroidales bacterium]